MTIAPTEPHPAAGPVTEYRRRIGPLRKAFNDGAGLVMLTLRLAWRHWPVLLSLALAGAIGRELLLLAAIRVNEVGTLVGFLVFQLTPMSLLVAMVLMLRTVRPSLPRIGVTAREPVLDHVGSVLVPFVLFYVLAGYVDYDWQRFQYAALLMDIDDIFAVGDPVRERFVSAGLAVIIAAGVAFALRWLVARLEVVRRWPVLGLLLAYLELLWIGTAFLLGRDYLPRLVQWWDDRVIWQSVVGFWRSDFAAVGALAAPLRQVRDFLGTIWPTTDDVLVVPLSALVAGAVVLGVSTGALQGTPWGGTRLGRILRIGGETAKPIDRLANLTRLLHTMRLMFRAGLVAMMAYCLLFVAVSAVGEAVHLLARLLIGPQSRGRFWMPLELPLDWFGEAVGLVLLICLIAAAVDRSPLGAASRQLSRSGEQAQVPRQLDREDDAHAHRLDV